MHASTVNLPDAYSLIVNTFIDPAAHELIVVEDAFGLNPCGHEMVVEPVVDVQSTTKVIFLASSSACA